MSVAPRPSPNLPPPPRGPKWARVALLALNIARATGVVCLLIVAVLGRSLDAPDVIRGVRTALHVAGGGMSVALALLIRAALLAAKSGGKEKENP